MCLTPPPLRSGSVPATASATAGMGERSRSAAAPPTPPSKSVSLIVCPVGWGTKRKPRPLHLLIFPIFLSAFLSLCALHPFNSVESSHANQARSALGYAGVVWGRGPKQQTWGGVGAPNNKPGAASGLRPPNRQRGGWRTGAFLARFPRFPPVCATLVTRTREASRRPPGGC